MADRIPCPACGADNEPGQRFCGSCGASVEVVCHACAASNEPGFRFCGSCGAPLAPLSPAAGEERKVVTVLFADLVGFTGRAERLDPEDVRAILSPYYARLRAELERFGGTVEKFIGDAVMALFGAPVSHGDDPERAVRAALAIRDALAELNEQNEELDLRVRVAVNTGEALVSLGARAAEGEGMAAGDVVNTASRLQTAAPVNGILVGEQTYRATSGVVRYEEIEPVEVQGKREAVRAWLALETIAAPAERPHRHVRLVGRDRELSVLAGIWQRVLDERRPHLVTVFGPPGIGKSRLGEEFERLTAADGRRVLRGRSLPYGGVSEYSPFAQQVKQVAGIFDTDRAPVALEKLEAAVRGLVREDGRNLAEQIGQLAGLTAGGSDRQVLAVGARRLVEALGREAPTVLLFEDIHWAAPAMLDLIETFGSRLRDAPVLVLTLTRPELLEHRSSWGGGLPAYSAVPLEPLTREQSEELAERLLEESGGAPVLASRLADTAEGNPLFLEELAATVAERAAAATEELPTNVRGIIAARLDTLPPPERSLVLDASVAGKVFWRGALGRMRSEENLDAVLDSLERRDLIRREPVSRLRGDEQFVFKHMLIREVAYATLSRASRRERHAAVARYFEEAAGDRVGEFARDLVHHWREAGESEHELRYLLLAADRGWPGEAIELYERALELVPEDDAKQARRIRLAHGVALFRGGSFQSANEVLDALLPELEEEERFQALDTRARATFWQADAVGARRFGDAAQSLARTLDSRELTAVSISFLGTVAAMEGEVEQAADQQERAIAAWVPGRHPAEHADAYTWAALEHYWMGDHERALDRARTAYETAKQAFHIEGLVNGTAHIGLALTGLGRHEEALEAFERGASEGIEFEPSQPRFTSRLTNMWAGTLRELGDLAEARRVTERAAELADQAAFPGAQISAKVDLLVTDLLEGDFGRAEAAWPALWQTAADTKNWHQWLWTTRLLHARSEIDLAKGDHERAVEDALAAIRQAERHVRRKYVVAGQITLARALAELRRADEAIGPARAALDGAERLKHPPSIVRAAETVANVLVAAGDDAGAETALGRSREALEAWIAALSDARRQRVLAAPALGELLSQR